LEKGDSMRRFPPARILDGLLGVVALCSVLPVTTHAAELPTRKPGLWEVKVVVAGGQLPPMTMQQCTDEATDHQLTARIDNAPASANCSKRDLEKTATGFVMDSVCTRGASMTVTSHAEITGDFNSAYTMKVSTQHTGAGAARDTNITAEAKWLGACAADQKPGDIIMPGGTKMNIKDMEAMKDNLKNMMKKQ
jgi:hypothetical protein